MLFKKIHNIHLSKRSRLSIQSNTIMRAINTDIRELELLLEDDKLRFLMPIKVLRNQIKDLIKDKPIRQSLVDCDIKNNFVKLEKGYAFPNEDLWETLFQLIINDTCAYKNPIYTHNRSNFTEIIDKVFSNIRISMNSKNSLELIKIINENNPSLPQVISLSLQSYLLSLRRKTALSFDDIEISYVKLTNIFGKAMLDSFLNSSMLKHLSYHNDYIIPIQKLDIFKKLIRAVVNKDLTQAWLILYDKFKFLNIQKDFLFIINLLIERYALDICLNNSTEYHDILLYLRTIYTHEEALVRRSVIDTEITAFYITLGSALTEEFVNIKFFQKFYKYENNMSALCLRISTKLQFELLETEAGYRPGLTPWSKHKHFKYYDKPLFSVYIKAIEKYIHPNKDFDVVAKQETKNFHSVNLSIDIAFLNFFLKLLLRYNKKDLCFIQDNQDLFQFLHIYDIDFKELYEISSKEIKKTIIEPLINFALDFNIPYIDDELKAILKIKSNIKYLKMYTKILNYKIYLKGLLKESLLYASFGFFIVEGFIDARARSYYTGYFLNPQNFFISRSLIKFYDPTPVTEDNFKTIKNAIELSIKKENPINLSYIQYKEKSNAIKTEFYSHYLKTPVNLNNIIQKNPTEIYTYVKENIKNYEDLFVITSYLQLEQQSDKKGISNIIGLDASISGYQMQAILFKDKGLAQICNLIGKEKNDIYSDIAKSFSKAIKEVTLVLDDFFKVISYKRNLVKNSFQPLNTVDFKELKNASLDEVLERFFTIELTETLMLKELIDLLYNKLSLFKIDYSTSKSFLWIIPRIEAITIKTVFSDYLLVLKEAYFLKYMLNEYPWLYEELNNRYVFKPLVMTLPYGGTHYGRITRMKTYFEEIFTTKNLDIKVKELVLLVYIIERYFQLYIGINLKATHKLTNIGKRLAKDRKGVVIANKYFKMKFEPKESKKMLIRIYDSRGIAIHRLTIIKFIYDKNNVFIVNKQQFISKFPSNFIHSMDAFLNMMFKELIYYINEKLAIKNIYLCHFSNHDFFSLSSIGFLTDILQDRYQELYSYDYIKTLEENLEEYVEKEGSPNYLEGKLENPYFIKV